MDKAKHINTDTVGIKISKPDFQKMVSKLTMETNDSTFKRSTDFYIDFVRVVNTIEKNNWFDEYQNSRREEAKFKKTRGDDDDDDD